MLTLANDKFKKDKSDGKTPTAPGDLVRKDEISDDTSDKDEKNDKVHDLISDLKPTAREFGEDSMKDL